MGVLFILHGRRWIWVCILLWIAREDAMEDAMEDAKEDVKEVVREDPKPDEVPRRGHGCAEMEDLRLFNTWHTHTRMYI